MQTRQKIHTKIGEQNRHKSEDWKIGDPFAIPSPHHPGMQQGCIYDKPGNQGPGLLRVPGPVTAPSWIRPDRTGNDADG